MSTLTANAYGKHKVRLSKITRLEDRHLFKEISVDVVLGGDFDQAYTDGDNSTVLPTDTIKNTVYVLAKAHSLDPLESFALDLSAHYLKHAPAATSADIQISEKRWVRMSFDDTPHPHAFIGGATELRTAFVLRTRDAVTVSGGIGDLPILKTTGSAFVGFLKDEYTVLPEERDRIMATKLDAIWTFESESADFNGAYERIREILLRVFANHESESVQHTLNEMGTEALTLVPEITEISMVMPNVHHFMFNLGRFGIENNNEIFAPADEPHGYIEGTVSR